jgi:hypothetical protein
MRVYAVLLHEGLRLKCSRLRPKSGLYHVSSADVSIKNDHLETCRSERTRHDFCTKIRVANGVLRLEKLRVFQEHRPGRIFSSIKEHRPGRCSREGIRVSRAGHRPTLQNHVVYMESRASRSQVRERSQESNLDGSRHKKAHHEGGLLESNRFRTCRQRIFARSGCSYRS